MELLHLSKESHHFLYSELYIAGLPKKCQRLRAEGIGPTDAVGSQGIDAVAVNIHDAVGQVEIGKLLNLWRVVQILDAEVVEQLMADRSVREEVTSPPDYADPRSSRGGHCGEASHFFVHSQNHGFLVIAWCRVRGTVGFPALEP